MNLKLENQMHSESIRSQMHFNKMYFKYILRQMHS